MGASVETKRGGGLRARLTFMLVTEGLAAVIVGYWVLLGTQGPGDGWQREVFVSSILLGALGAGVLGSVVRSRRVGVACAALIATWSAIWGFLGIFSIGLPLLIVASVALYLTASSADGVDGHPSAQWAVAALALTGTAGVALTAVCLLAT